MTPFVGSIDLLTWLWCPTSVALVIPVTSSARECLFFFPDSVLVTSAWEGSCDLSLPRS